MLTEYEGLDLVGSWANFFDLGSSMDHELMESIVSSLCELTNIPRPSTPDDVCRVRQYLLDLDDALKALVKSIKPLRTGVQEHSRVDESLSPRPRRGLPDAL